MDPSAGRAAGDRAKCDGGEAAGLIRFGRIVRDRREELGLRQDELKAIGGPSSTTMVKVEKGTPRRRRR